MLKGIVSEEMEKTVTLFHLLFCTLRHELIGPKDDPKSYPEFCTFEQEEQRDNTWEEPAHRGWVEYTNKTAEILEVSVEEIHTILTRLREPMREIEMLMQEDANIVSVLRLFIDSREGLADLGWWPRAIVRVEEEDPKKLERIEEDKREETAERHL